MILVRPDGWESLSHRSPALGESPETEYEQFGYELQPGEALAIFTAGLRDARDERNRPLGEAGLGEVLVENLHLTADLMAALVRDRCEADAPPTAPSGVTPTATPRAAPLPPTSPRPAARTAHCWSSSGPTLDVGIRSGTLELTVRAPAPVCAGMAELADALG